MRQNFRIIIIFNLVYSSLREEDEIIILLFKPENSESEISFFQESCKQISKENSSILGKLDDISRLTIDKGENSVLSQLPDAKTVTDLSETIKNLFDY